MILQSQEEIVKVRSRIKYAFKLSIHFLVVDRIVPPALVCEDDFQGIRMPSPHPFQTTEPYKKEIFFSRLL